MRRFALLLLLTGLVALWLPDSIEAQAADLVTQGRQALDADRVDEALALLEKAVGAEPRNPAALAWLGSAQVRKAGKVGGMEAAGWVKRGFDSMDEAVERFPEAFIVYVVRGSTAGRVPPMFNKTELAVKDLSTVVTMKDRKADAVPDGVMPLVYLNLGLAQKKAGRPAEARAAWEQGRRLYPAAPEAATIERELRGL
jgi:tetratricopeptide (TPR) repeat protein